MKLPDFSQDTIFHMRQIKRNSVRYCDCCKCCSHGKRIRRGGITSNISLGVLGPVDRKVKVYNRKRYILKPLGLRLSSVELMNRFSSD